MFWRINKEGGGSGSGQGAAGGRHPFYYAAIERPALWKTVIRLGTRTPEADRRVRQLNAYLYQLAAEIESRSEAAGLGWEIVPDAANRTIKLEDADSDDPGIASVLIVQLLKERGLR